MKLNEVRIENFLSVKDASINFEDFDSIVHVVGLNKDQKPTVSNGAGKSTIIEAVLFALFGKTLRKTNDKSLQNYHTKGKCKVTLRVNDTIIIERTKKPPRLSVEVGGENYSQDSIANTQKYLEKILNTNLNVFLASMVFGQQNSMNFLTATPDEKRSIIQSFLSVGNLFEHRAAIKRLKTFRLTNKKVALTLHNDSLQKISSLEGKIKGLLKDKREGSKCLTKEVKEFIRKHSFSEIRDLEVEEQRLNYELNSYQALRNETSKGITQTKQILKSMENEGVCESCGWVTSSVYSRKLQLQDSLDEAYKVLKSYEENITTTIKGINKINLPIKSLDLELIESLKTIDTQLKVLRTQKRAEVKLAKKYGKDSMEQQKKYDLLRFWEQAFSEVGLVKYIISHILEYFNERANHYLSLLSSGNFKIEFDDTLDEIIYYKGKAVFFNSLSGGEKKRISLGVMLALNDLLVLSGKERSNLIFFDEIADSLDEEGVKGLLELIHLLTKETNKKLFIITHNDYFVSLLEEYCEQLKVVKKNNITKFTK